MLTFSTRIFVLFLVFCLLAQPTLASERTSLFDVPLNPTCVFSEQALALGATGEFTPLPDSKAKAGLVRDYRDDEQILQETRKLLPHIKDFLGMIVPKGMRWTMAALRKRFPDVFGNWESAQWRTFWHELVNNTSAYHPRKWKKGRGVSILANRLISGNTLEEVGAKLDIHRERVRQLETLFFRRLAHEWIPKTSVLGRTDPRFLDQSVNILNGVSDRTKNRYASGDIHTLKDLTFLTTSEFLRTKGAGHKALDQSITALAAYGLSFARTGPIDASLALSPEDPRFLEQSVDILDQVSNRTRNIYRLRKIRTLKDLTLLSEAEFLRTKGAGHNALDETKAALAARGLAFALEPKVERVYSLGILEFAPAAFVELCRQIVLFPLREIDSRVGVYNFTQLYRAVLRYRLWAGGSEYKARFSFGSYDLSWTGRDLHVRHDSSKGFVVIPVLAVEVRSDGPRSLVLRLPLHTIKIFQARGLPLIGGKISPDNVLERWRIEALEDKPATPLKKDKLSGSA